MSQCNVTTVEDFVRPKSKQTCKHRTLFLFNDMVVVTKPNKGRYNLKQMIPLLGIGVRSVVRKEGGKAGTMKNGEGCKPDIARQSGSILEKDTERNMEVCTRGELLRWADCDRNE